MSPVTGTRQRWVLGSLFMLFLVTHLRASPPQDRGWRTQTRLQATYEFDDNVFESISDSIRPIEDTSLKFIFHWRASWQQPRRRLTLAYRSGLQTYFDYPRDNKLIHDFDGRLTMINEKITLGLRAHGRLKLYLNDVLDYVRGWGEIFVRLPSMFRLEHEIAFRGGRLHYQEFADFDFGHTQLFWRASRPLASPLNLRLELAGQRSTYNRSALVYQPEDSTLSSRGVQQEDRRLAADMRVNYTRSMLVSLGYGFEYNDSNSFGFSYHQHRVVGLFGLSLPGRIWLRGYGGLQWKVYREALPRALPVDVERERTESNFLIVDVSRDLNPTVALLVRLAYYDNESIIRGAFYRKTVLSAGVDIRF